MKSIWRTKPVAAYLRYLPAGTTLVGAVLVAVGLFFGQGQSANGTFQWFRLVGACIAGLGAFWSAHRQVQSAAGNKERDQKIIDLSEELHGHLTGGNSFCYGYPWLGPESSPVFQWTFVHSGQYPLTDVSVRIHNLALPAVQLGRNVNLGTLFPGKALNIPVQDTKQSSHGYNLFFVARNGSWTQEIRWAQLVGVFAVANRVVRDSLSLDNPLLCNVSPEFPGNAPADKPWADRPPYTASG